MEREYVFVEDEHAVWHVRVDDFWNNDITASVRAHAVCGNVWSCHVSAWPPVLGDQKAQHCGECFPTPIGGRS